ncbi:MAG: beta-ketoacyl-[acyl-carrier-protein] synthase family protein [Lentisphaerae bacterium]|nr:beta-ketoacyl-[acyl-carrier-protein] synthase family protein [Lentisphaerota bacterium]
MITGLGVVAPNGTGVRAFWKSLVAGRSGIGPVTLFDASDMPCRIAGEVNDFDPDAYLDPRTKAGKRMSRASQFAVGATCMALEDAGLTVSDLRQFVRVPVVIGVSTSAMDLIAQHPRPWTAVSAVPHAVTSAVSFTLGFDARLVTISDGCASGLDAVCFAAGEVCAGREDLVIAGASDSAVARYVFECFSKSRKLSTRNDEPERASRPFDRDRDGGVISEAAGVVVVENHERALARGARPYGEVLGYGSCADPVTMQEATGLEWSMRLALANAACPAEQVDNVSAHGPGDEYMDGLETVFIKRVLGARAYRIPVTSIKGVTGNPMGAGGILQLIAAALTLRHDTVIPTANLEHPDPACDLDYAAAGARRARLNTVMINTHGFGRGNTSLLLRRSGNGKGV